MGQVIAMRAIPGSGKSTLAKQLINKTKEEGKTAVICSADDYFVELGKGTYKFDPSKISEAHKACFKKFMHAITSGIDLIIVDNTNLSAWELSPYKTYAEANDYDFAINEVVADPAEAFKRQHHGVPQRGMEFMHNRFNQEFIPPWWEKKRMISKTNEAGEPAFEEEVIEESPQLDLPFPKKPTKESSASLNRLFRTASKIERKYS